ncbi:MAG: glycosyltransferase [Pirellulales bacterium]
MLSLLTTLPILTWLGLAAILSYLGLLTFKMQMVVSALRANQKTDSEMNVVQFSVRDAEPSRSENSFESSASTSNDAGVLMTIMQPILSGDPQLEAMLEANVQLTNRRVQFLWLVDEADTRAQQITQGIRSRQDPPEQHRLAFCFAQTVPEKLNPKAFKLNIGLIQVRSQYVAVLDDDTCLANGNLEQAIDRLNECDLYTGLPLFQASKGIGSQLVAQFVNNNSLVTYLAVARLLPPITINGMFYVARTEYLKSLQAFKTIEAELCDDLALATHVRRSGGKVHQGTAPLELRVSVHDAKHYWSIMHRWFVFADILTAKQSLVTQLTLGLLLGLPSVLLWLALLTAFTSVAAFIACCLTLTVRHALIQKMLRETKVEGLPIHLVWSLVSELLQPLHFIHAKLVRTIHWRHRTIRVHRNGSFQETRSIHQ